MVILLRNDVLKPLFSCFLDLPSQAFLVEASIPSPSFLSHRLLPHYPLFPSFPNIPPIFLHPPNICCSMLSDLVLQGNPISVQKNYKMTVRGFVLSLKRLDGLPIRTQSVTGGYADSYTARRITCDMSAFDDKIARNNSQDVSRATRTVKSPNTNSYSNNNSNNSFNGNSSNNNNNNSSSSNNHLNNMRSPNINNTSMRSVNNNDTSSSGNNRNNTSMSTSNGESIYIDGWSSNSTNGDTNPFAPHSIRSPVPWRNPPCLLPRGERTWT